MPPSLVCFGEALIDVHPDRAVVAGAPLHVAVHLAQRGWRSRLVSRVGADVDGARVRRVLERCGVATDMIETDPGLPTGRVTVTYGASGDHAFTIHRPAAWDAIRLRRLPPAHDVLCYGTLAARDARSRSALGALLAASTAPLRAFDANLRPPDVNADVVQLGLAAATLLKVSADELRAMSALLGTAATAAAIFAHAPRLRWLCVTRGAQGAAVHTRDGRTIEADAPSVVVVDTVGAGDAFTAGLLDVLGRGGTSSEALDSGLSLAASVLARRGGLPPCAEEGE